METCTKCKKEKPLTDFPNDKNRKNGLSPWCRDCISVSQKAFRANNKEIIRQRKRLGYLIRKGLTKDEALKYIEKKENEKHLTSSGHKTCPKCGVKKSFIDYKPNKNRKNGIDYWCRDCANKYSLVRFHSEKGQAYLKKNADKIKEQSRKHGLIYREKNKESIRLKKQQYYESYYKVARRGKIAKYMRERRKSDKIFSLNKNISYAIWKSLKQQKNGCKWETFVGFNLKELKTHLEKQFKYGMTWENYGRNGWEIDHVIPLSIFNIDGPNSKGFKKAWALENLRPLWRAENLNKRDKLFAA